MHINIQRASLVHFNVDIIIIENCATLNECSEDKYEQEEQFAEIVFSPNNKNGTRMNEERQPGVRE